MTQQEHQQLLEEMRQDLLAEAKADKEYERKLRTDINYALDELEKEYHYTECFINITNMLKKLNNLGYDITIQELYNLY